YRVLPDVAGARARATAARLATPRAPPDSSGATSPATAAPRRPARCRHRRRPASPATRARPARADWPANAARAPDRSARHGRRREERRRRRVRSDTENRLAVVCHARVQHETTNGAANSKTRQVLRGMFYQQPQTCVDVAGLKPPDTVDIQRTPAVPASAQHA